MPQAILFDLHGTLTDTTQADTAAVAAIRTIMTKAGVRVSDTSILAAEQFAVDAFAPNLWESVIFKLANRDPALAFKCVTEFRKTPPQKIVFRPGVVELLKKCKEYGWKTALMNRLSEDTVAQLARAQIMPLIDVQGLPTMAKIELPDMRAFEFVLGNLGCEPRECILVGTRLDIVVRAGNDLRMKTILLRMGKHGQRQQPRDLQDLPGNEVNTFAELGLTLETLRG
ncbi:MAG: HAD hydrolase-like protein [Planctomycetes bacterium]|nr:HAD hydrolase-like protein [Planctomycetota bacterium]